MAWSVQAKRNVIGLVWMAGGMALLTAAILRNPVFLTALVGLAVALYAVMQLLRCPRCGRRVYVPSDPVRGRILRRLPATCPGCGLETTKRG
ncbi:MAG TPA: hypothetical protein VNE16_05085 [Vicinamibacterales bacterium]|nr:hypothetical protein [Vicinamibacterales bacterium]